MKHLIKSLSAQHTKFIYDGELDTMVTLSTKEAPADTTQALATDVSHIEKTNATDNIAQYVGLDTNWLETTSRQYVERRKSKDHIHESKVRTSIQQFKDGEVQAMFTDVFESDDSGIKGIWLFDKASEFKQQLFKINILLQIMKGKDTIKTVTSWFKDDKEDNKKSSKWHNEFKNDMLGFFDNQSNTVEKGEKEGLENVGVLLKDWVGENKWIQSILRGEITFGTLLKQYSSNVNTQDMELAIDGGSYYADLLDNTDPKKDLNYCEYVLNSLYYITLHVQLIGAIIKDKIETDEKLMKDPEARAKAIEDANKVDPTHIDIKGKTSFFKDMWSKWFSK